MRHLAAWIGKTQLQIGTALLASALAAPASAELVAERIDARNALRRLFGGTDAAGGIGDWYLSNGIVEAVIDDVGPQSDLPPGVEPPPLQNLAGVSGGTLLDLGLVDRHDDQLSHLFTVAGLSSANFIAYHAIEAEVSAATAILRVRGGALGFDPLAPEELPVVTEYVLAEGDDFLTLRSRVENLGESPASFLGGFLDVMPWTTRAILPFSPIPGRGFDHAQLDVDNPLASLEQPPYAVGPGNVSPADGVTDPQTGRPAGEVCYGLLGIEAGIDADGPGPMPPFVRPANQLFGASSVQATALGNVPTTGALLPGQAVHYERRIYVGARNEVASTANPMLRALAARNGFATGTLSGDLDAVGSPDVAASGIATRVGGPPIPRFPNGTPVTQFRTDAAGRFAGVVVPVGTYRVELRAPERDALTVTGVEVVADAETLVAAPPFSATGSLHVRIGELRAHGKAKGKGKSRGKTESRALPARITLLGVGDTPDPRFGWDVAAAELASTGAVDLRPESFGGALAQANVVLLPHGDARVELRPGRYEVFASRGPEYGIARAELEVAPGGEHTLDFALARWLPTPDALSADFHIHSARSLDSSATPIGRVAAFAAEGVEVMVSTDHDFVLDYAPVIEALGLRGFVTSRIGLEVTTSVGIPPVFPDAVGHLIGWPLRVRPLARKDGAIEDEGVAPNFLYSRLRRAGARVVQYNHPRAGVRGLGSIGFFNNIGCGRCLNDVDRVCALDADCPAAPAPRSCGCVGYQPDRALTDPPNDLLLDDDVTGDSGVANPDGFRNIDFDVLEVANGLDAGDLLEVRRDWFSLLDQAHAETPSGPVPFLPGSGVSDSHRNSLETAGYFRSYVLGTGDVPRALDARRFDRHVKQGRMLLTTGPWIELDARDARSGRRAGIGDTLRPRGRDLELRVRVLAAPWVPVDEVRVLANGETLRVFDASTTPAVRPGAAVPWHGTAADVLRFEARVPLHLEQDAWILVEAGAPVDPPPVPDAFATRIVPGWFAWAFTNPIFVDLAGDGFDPPGVSAMAGVSPTAPAGLAPTHAHPHAAPLHRLLDLRGMRIAEDAYLEAVQQ